MNHELAIKILHLNLKKKWFDMILSGEKKEEYRELKDYYHSRLRDKGYCIKKFDYIEFKNGYSKDAPRFMVEFISTQIREGKTEWGAELGKTYYVISLGKITQLTQSINELKKFNK